ncbi:MAG: flippase-like domain-containing protein [Proteobacteria bacterium]|nr:flippase-like domain-containing protein [Pseudomonadota bacterium]
MKRLLAVALSIALLAWLASNGHWRALAESFVHLPASVLALAGLGFAASYVLRALRVFDEFRSDARGHFAACLRIVLIHNAMVNVVPFRGGEAAFPLLLRQTFGTPVARAVASLFWFRLQDALVVGIVAAAVWPGVPLALRAAGALGLILFALALPRWARARHDWAERGALAAKLGKLRDAFADSTRHARFGWLWTVANWSVKLAAQSLLLAAVLGASLGTGAAGALGAELAAILPIQGVAGFGTYEAGAAAALLPSGIGFEEGLRAALALHLFVIGCALAAGALAALLIAAPRAATPSGSPPPSNESSSTAPHS